MSQATPITFGASGLRLLWISALVIIADQFSKLWISTNLREGESVPVWPVLNIVRAHNEGAAWSMFANAGGWQRWAFSALAAVVSVALVVWLRRLQFAAHKLLSIGIALILGGAIGNLIDRVRLGHVVDFVDVYWGTAHFPAFNIADAAISIGAALVILDSLRESLLERQAARVERK